MATLSDEKFIEFAENELKRIVDGLGWDYNALFNEEPEKNVECPVDKNHIIKKTYLENHLRNCKKDILFTDSSPGNPSVRLTPELQQQIILNAAKASNIQTAPWQDDLIAKEFLGNLSVIRSIPKSSTEYTRMFTRDEKLAIYNYVISQTKRTNNLTDLVLLDEGMEVIKTKEMSELELAAAERDAKRRRISYRKRIHAQNKSYTEILREIIESKFEYVRHTTNQT